MPLDALFLKGLQTELSETLSDMKIDKVQQPSHDIILLHLRGKGKNLRLLLCTAPGRARAHITNQGFENPQAPPMFCMLLRKHLSGARIQSITQPVGERVLVFDLQTLDEMGHESPKQLILEMMGNQTNFILTDIDGRIIDCLRRVGMDTHTTRQILPGMFYRAPESQGKPPFLSVDADMLTQYWNHMSNSVTVDQWLLQCFSGISPLVCREICYQTFGEVSPHIQEVTPAQYRIFEAKVLSIAEDMKQNQFAPVMLKDSSGPKDFSLIPITQYGAAMQSISYDNFSKLLDDFYAQKEKIEIMRRQSQSLLKTVKTLADRQRRKLLLQQEELKKTGLREQMRKYGDLVTANLYQMKKGQRTLVTQDFYSETCSTIEIPLDPLKSPQENAAQYYKEYNKQKTAEMHLLELIKSGNEMLKYLESCYDTIVRCDTKQDLEDIRRELIAMKLIKQQGVKKGKQKKDIQAKPRRFLSSTGMEILVGRSNTQNDILTLKTARRTDYWLHAQKIHGSHVIITCNGNAPDEQTLLEAAILAAYYSQGRDSGNIAVDYTQIRFVKKPSGALPGAVIYTDYKTLIVPSHGDAVAAITALS